MYFERDHTKLFRYKFHLHSKVISHSKYDWLPDWCVFI
jgi:hypothetical protein